MLEQTADVPQGKLRQARISIAGKQWLSTLPERLVRMHSAAVVAKDGLRHERDRLAVATGHVLDDVFVEQHLVGGAEKRVVLQVDLSLAARRDFVMMAFDF